MADKEYKPIKINIAGRDYSLLGENEAVIKKAADEVNKQIKEIKQVNLEEPAATVNVLAALNIAEKYINDRTGISDQEEYVVSKLIKMAEFLRSN